MIAHISGNVLSKSEKSLVIDVNGLGYSVQAPVALLESAELHLPIELHIHTIVREDDISLYGFENTEYLRLFKMLISVNGVGARIAMDCFASPIDVLKQAIIQGDIARLTQIQGIGKKTAERIILELKEKLISDGEITVPLETTAENQKIEEEVLHALLGLGYHRGDIKRVLRSIKDPMKNSEEMIKYFLRHV